MARAMGAFPRTSRTPPRAFRAILAARQPEYAWIVQGGEGIGTMPTASPPRRAGSRTGAPLARTRTRSTQRGASTPATGPADHDRPEEGA